MRRLRSDCSDATNVSKGRGAVWNALESISLAVE